MERLMNGLVFLYRACIGIAYVFVLPLIIVLWGACAITQFGGFALFWLGIVGVRWTRRIWTAVLSW